MAKIIDGKVIGDAMLEDIKQEVATLVSGGIATRKPGLAVVIVGERKDSQTYVRLKHRSAEYCGMKSFQAELPGDVTQEKLNQELIDLSANPEVDGIILQLPLPKHLDANAAILHIDPKKDVDGLHPINVGYLNFKGVLPLFSPCTPCGVMTLLAQADIETKGKDAIVIGRSHEVGLPVVQMLQQGHATVTLCHTRTLDLAGKCKRADIVIAAAGSQELVRGDWVKPGAAVVDVGIHALPDPTKKIGQRLVGDVAFDEVAPHASFITPVPGGVGPMTVASLLHNTLRGFQRGLNPGFQEYNAYKKLPVGALKAEWTTYNHYLPGNFKKLANLGVKIFRK